MKTPDQVFDELSEQIMRCHVNSASRMIEPPLLRTVISVQADKLLRRSVEMIRADHHTLPDPWAGPEPEFRGSKLTIVPGADIYFHTRCTNLP